jgi:hypothetical protein
VPRRIAGVLPAILAPAAPAQAAGRRTTVRIVLRPHGPGALHVRARRPGTHTGRLTLRIRPRRF